MIDKPICFLAMPFGRTEAEQLPYAGWRTAALAPAIEECGFRVELAVNNPDPVPITEQMLRFLVEAPMAVFDLGGFGPEDIPNPNVMYELGIRHAFGLPAVVYSPSPRLPFDLTPGRAVVAPRALESAKGVSKDLADQIRSAMDGRFWKPMDAVGRVAQLQNLAQTHAGLEPLVDAVQGLTAKVESIQGVVLRQKALHWDYGFADDLPHVLWSSRFTKEGNRTLSLEVLRDAVIKQLRTEAAKRSKGETGTSSESSDEPKS